MLRSGPGIFCVFVILTLSSLQASAQLVINEFSASNASGGYYDAANDNYPDWIEIYNASATSIDLSGYYLSDDLSDLNKWKIPSGTLIVPQGFLLFLADDLDTGNHTNFKLNAEGESIGLSDPNKVLLDHVIYMPQSTNISMGRMLSDPGTWAYYPDPTPGTSNSTEAYTAKALSPVISHDAGFYAQPVSLELSTPITTASIRYTLDGSTPGSNSTLYSGPISINSSTVVKAICLEEGKMSSEVISGSYFIGEQTSLPVFSFSMPSSQLSFFPFGIESPVHVEYFDDAKKQVISQRVGVRETGLVGIHPMRSFSMYARSEYGENRLNHRFFKDKTLTSFKNLVLRNGGYQDYSHTYMRDGLIQSFVVDKLDIDYQAYQPVLVYKNGDFLALMNMREKMNEFYVEYNNQVDKDSIDLLEYQTDPPIDVLAGDADHFNAMMDFIETSDFSQQTNMEYLETQMDVENYLDYYMLQIYCANADWPDKNCKIWRPKRDGGRWRWMIFDVDYGYGFRFPVETNMYEYLYTLEEPYYHNRPWVTVIFRKIMENDDARNYFLQRFCALLNTTFSPDQAIHMVDSLKAQIEPEIGRHIDQWGHQPYGIPSMEEWQGNCDTLYKFAAQRPKFARENMNNFFGLDDTVMVKITAEGGTVFLNDLAYCKDSVSGVFFKNLPLQLKAIPDPGYRFVHWAETPDITSPSLSFIPASDTSITALFVATSDNILPGVFSRDTVLRASEQPYISRGDLVIPAHTKVTFDQGVRLLMPEKCNIYVYGELIIKGAESSPVEINAYTGSWGGICLNNSTGTSEFSHLVLKNASSGGEPELYDGAIATFQSDLKLSDVVIEKVPFNAVSARYSNIWVNHCKFQSEGTCDLINVKYADTAIVENSVFKDSKSIDTDAIDYDAIKFGIIRNNLIYNLVGENSDGIDIGEGAQNIRISENRIFNCSDKGISVGQASSMYADRNIIFNCNNGIAVKDFGSVGSVINNTLVNNALGVSSYEKNLGSGAGSVHIQNTILADSRTSSILVRNDGELLIEYSLSNTDILSGTGNLYASPGFIDPGIFNFELLPDSPCIDGGSLDSPLDEDGSRADIGAYYLAEQVEINGDLLINEFYSNATAEDPEDWIEIYNKGNASIDLSGWYLVDGGNDYFRFPEHTLLAEESYLLVCRDTSNFKDFFDADCKLYGNFNFSLGKARDAITILNKAYSPVNTLRYDENEHWPESSDKLLLSVALIDTSLSIREGYNWRTGYKLYGTPGYTNLPPLISGLFLNEISGKDQLAFPDNFGEYEDWIELYNGNENPVNSGGLFLTDDLQDLCKSRIPQNRPDSTRISPYGFQVLFADGDRNQGVLHLDFRISSSGEELGLVQLVGLDTIILDQLVFGEFSSGQSLGRRIDGGVPWEVQEFSPGSANNRLDVEIAEEFSAWVYPVPADDRLNLRLSPAADSELQIQLINALGQVVLLEERPDYVGGSILSINVSSFKQGMYYLKITCGELSTVKKISISR